MEEDINPIVSPEMLHKSYEASNPYGNLAKKTRGRQPRSREASSRTMFERRTAEEIARFSDVFERDTTEKTHIDPALIPKGFSVLWARQFFRGMPDSSNLRDLERKGWKYATPDFIPSLYNQNPEGDIDDSSDRITLNEFYLMYRENEIQALEMAKYNRKTQEKKNATNHVASSPYFTSDSHAFGGIDRTRVDETSGARVPYTLPVGGDTELAQEFYSGTLGR